MATVSSPDAIWTSQEPLYSKFYSYSPYSYCVRNPIKMIDPDGKRVFEHFKVYVALDASKPPERQNNAYLFLYQTTSVIVEDLIFHHSFLLRHNLFR